MIPVTKTLLPPLQDYVQYLERIWQNGWITNSGELSVQLGEQLRAYLAVPNLELVANGTLALQLAIRALGLSGEIITTPYSYVATTSAIVWEHCDPVFVDIDPDTLCIDPSKIEAAITSRTSAILATHVYGYPCDVEAIRQIAERHGLKVIYDAAHAFGVKLNGQSLVNFGDISTLSFHATKLFHTAEGGAVICRDAAVMRTVELMRQFGHEGEDEYLSCGVNAKISELHAAMGLCLLPQVPDVIAERRLICAQYDARIPVEVCKRPRMPDGLEYNYSYYPVLFSSHDIMMRVRGALIAQNIMPRRYFYPALNTLPWLRADLRKCCPVAEDIALRVLCLPVYSGLALEDTERISHIVNEAAQ